MVTNLPLAGAEGKVDSDPAPPSHVIATLLTGVGIDEDRGA